MNSMEVSKFLTKNLDGRLYAIESLIEKGGEKEIVDLMELFKVENEITVLNKIAMGFADLKVNQSVQLLMDYIKNPNFKDKRGTFIYALQDLDCKNYFLDFAEMICTGNFEVYDHSYLVLESIVPEVDDNQKFEAIQILEKQKLIELSKSKSKHPQFDRINYINEALELLKETTD